MRTQHLADIRDMRRHAVCAAGGAGEQIAMLVQPPDGAIIKDNAIFAQHEGVTATPDGQFAYCGGADDVEESGSVGAADFKFGERGHVGHPDIVAHGLCLTQRSLRQTFAAYGVSARAEPIAQWLPNRVFCRVQCI